MGNISDKGQNESSLGDSSTEIIHRDLRQQKSFREKEFGVTEKTMIDQAQPQNKDKRLSQSSQVKIQFGNKAVPIIKYSKKTTGIRIGKFLQDQVIHVEPDQSLMKVQQENEVSKTNLSPQEIQKEEKKKQQEKKKREQKKKQKKQEKEKKKYKKLIKEVQEKITVLERAYAIGHLIGVNDLGVSVRTYGIFQGTFEGAFKFHSNNLVYFEGKIKQMSHQIALKYPKQRTKKASFSKYKENYSIIVQTQTMDDKGHHLNLNDLDFFKGGFKGIFTQAKDYDIKENKHNKYKAYKLVQKILKGKEINLLDQINDQITNPRRIVRPVHLKQSDKKLPQIQNEVNYMIPAMTTFNLKKITQVNLQRSNANISGTFNIDIRLNQQVVNVFEAEKKRKYLQDLTQKEIMQFERLSGKQQKDKIQKEKIQFELAIDFHRGKLMNLPFYIVYEEDDDDDKIPVLEEWAEPLEGIDHNSYWDKDTLIMSYRITTIFTAEINNSYGIFYSPFNVNTIKLIVDFHALKIGQTRIDINCCDLSDSYNDGQYSPYTVYNSLKQGECKSNKTNLDIRFRKHFDRLSKIDTSHYIDTGYYQISNNQMTLFPYYKRVLANSEYLTRKFEWICGIFNKYQYIKKPQVKSIQDNYKDTFIDPKKKYQNLKFPVWEYVHIQIPIYKYAVIDMIRIFIPILILSSISLLIFRQENGKIKDEQSQQQTTTLSYRIASAFSLLIAYIALVPLIRANLPPTPAITLVQILIYSSTIPNFLAVISNLTTNFTYVQQFFAGYYAFQDGLFLGSFIITIISIVTIIIIIVGIIFRDDKRSYEFKKIKKATVEQMRSPLFLEFIHEVKEKRPSQYFIQQLEFPQKKLPQKEPQKQKQKQKQIKNKEAKK